MTCNLKKNVVCSKAGSKNFPAAPFFEYFFTRYELRRCMCAHVQNPFWKVCGICVRAAHFARFLHTFWDKIARKCYILEYPSLFWNIFSCFARCARATQKKGRNSHSAFLQLAAEKKYSKNGAAENFFGPSYFVTALGEFAS